MAAASGVRLQAKIKESELRQVFYNSPWIRITRISTGRIYWK